MLGTILRNQLRFLTRRLTAMRVIPEQNSSCVNINLSMSPVLSILITEAAERFSYYCFRAILVLYFRSHLHFSDSTSIALFAYTTCLAYSSPVLGAWLSDVYWGRYTTILVFGCVYVAGLAFLTIGAFLPSPDERGLSNTSTKLFTFVGLFLTCLGTGGLKPCVSAFGADQVLSISRRNVETEGCDTAIDTESNKESDTSNREKDIRRFYSNFYFCINLGSVASFILIPIIRSSFGFGVAFFVPTIFVIIALACFVINKPKYLILKPTRKGNDCSSSSFASTFTYLWHFGKERLVSNYSDIICNYRIDSTVITPQSNAPSFSQNQKIDAEAIISVILILASLPIFWMLYDQNSSVWTLQATKMNLHGLYPEQMGIVNPLLIIIMLPCFDRLVYPALQNRELDKMKDQHLQRMACGMLFATFSFIICGFLQHGIDTHSHNTISVVWQLPQIITLTIAEILLSVTGLEFAYLHSPETLKTTVMALYLLTAAVGNLMGGFMYSILGEWSRQDLVMHFCAFLMLINFIFFLRVKGSWEKNRKTIHSTSNYLTFQDRKSVV